MTDDASPAEGLAVDGLTVRIDASTVVDDVSCTVRPGEVAALVGPSGCGKSTLLRAIAGLQPSTGTVRWGGDDVSGQRPDRRRFGLMFQDHALFGHRDVADNVAFGLRMDGVDRPTRARRVDEVLELVGLPGFGPRSIETLSGGEAQRVALARSLAPRPRVLMLDEPLGSLDRTLRDRLAADLRRILVDAAVAAIHVTHDQEEAYGVADRLLVMRDGRVVRDGAVATVWSDPGSAFVARFLGHDNVLDPGTARSLGLAVPDAAAAIVVREAAVHLDADPPIGSTDPVGPLDAVVVDVRFRGATSRVELAVAHPTGSATLFVHRSRPPVVGDRLLVRIDPAAVATLA